MPKPMRPFSFGPYSRYRASEFQTRFGTTEFHVHDAETTDPVTGGPALVRQFDTRAALDAFVLAVDDDPVGPCPNCGNGPSARPAGHAGDCVSRGSGAILGGAAD